MVVFDLTMPSIGSWNGRWSGGGERFAKVLRLPKAQEAALDGQAFYHTFSDGWVACIEARRVDARAAAKARKQSRGFCGYDWMVDSIVQHGRIVLPVRPSSGSGP